MMNNTLIVPATSRFSNRADNYVKYRPGYPEVCFDFLQETLQLDAGSTIVDIGSGTGLFAEPFLARGFEVTGIEPNDEMRRAAEHRLARYPGFRSLATTAEETGLPDASADLVTIAQTFHWLDAELTRKECVRILKPGGKVVMAWNRQLQVSDVEKEYTSLRETYRLTPATGRSIDIKVINRFFDPLSPGKHTLPNPQLLNFESLKGQLLSKTYIPLPGDEEYERMIGELIRLFVRSNENGFVKIDHETVLYYGTPSSH
ncbi:MAG: class I SAM-dependent methyltransferase [Chitinophagaceae bacterium]|nr:MAG: class I SAM-dependent methyltransferase [Chitinophagaceae bacterium]